MKVQAKPKGLPHCVFTAVPKGFLGMLCLIAAVEYLLGRHEQSLSTVVTTNSRFAAWMAASEAPHCQVLVFGDSQVKCGVEPKIIEDCLNVRAYNLAILASPPPASYFLLRRALRAGAHPAAVLIGHMTFAGNLQEQAQSLQGLVGLRDCIDLARETHDLSFAATLLLTRWTPSLKFRWLLRKQLIASLEGRRKPEKVPVQECLNQWISSRGALLVSTNAAFDGRMEPEKKATVYSKRWMVNAVYARYLRRFLDLAAAHKITVFCLLSPIVPEAQAMRDSIGLDDLHTRNVRALLARHPNTVVIDIRHAGYPPTAFADSCHLNAQGARNLSAEIGSIIRQRLADADGNRRWVEVSSYREHSSGRSGETMARRSSHWPGR